jgi:hypothetical protein
MNVRGRDELREGFEELEEREQQLSAAVGVAFGETVEKAALGRRKGGRGVEGVQSFEREGRAGTVADETPDARPARTSIVDLLKLLEIDSSYAARKALATELGCPADLMRDSARMNMWLHKTVLARVAANGGNVPHSLLD